MNRGNRYHTVVHPALITTGFWATLGVAAVVLAKFALYPAVVSSQASPEGHVPAPAVAANPTPSPSTAPTATPVPTRVAVTTTAPPAPSRTRAATPPPAVAAPAVAAPTAAPTPTPSPTPYPTYTPVPTLAPAVYWQASGNGANAQHDITEPSPIVVTWSPGSPSLQCMVYWGGNGQASCLPGQHVYQWGGGGSWIIITDPQNTDAHWSIEVTAYQ